MTETSEVTPRCGYCSALRSGLIAWPSLETSLCPPCNEKQLAGGLEPTPQCLRSHEGTEGCEGPVTYRLSHAGTGLPVAECSHHQDVSARYHEGLRERYPDSDTPPAWFDPTNAGETWSDE